jgi:MOSC domain-containing protein YiiM
MGELLQVNVGPAQTYMIGGRLVETAIVKTPTAGPVRLGNDHVEGDTQANPVHHGGRDQAVYAYDRASYDAWEAERDQKLPSGFFGENLTLSGIDVDHARIAERWRIGDRVEVEVTSPRIPCAKLDWRMQDAFQAIFLHADRPGAYLRIVTPGEVEAGDDVELVWRPDHEVTVTDVMAMWRGDDVAGHVLTAGDHLPDETRRRAEQRAARAG